MHTANIVRDANGVPTGLAGIATESVFGGVMAGVTQIIDEDKVVIPGSMLEKLAVEGTKVAIGGAIDKRLVTGEWGIPFKG